MKLQTQSLVRIVSAVMLSALLHACVASDDDPLQMPSQEGGSGTPAEPPGETPADGAGTLLETTVARTPAGTPLAERVIRLSYRMDANGGGVTSAVALLFLPSGEAPASGHPLVVWAHGTTGVSDACAPSNAFDNLGNPSVVNRLLDAGYAVLAPDYEGLGTPGVHPYLVRSSHANSLLDAVPAAHQIQGVSLSTSWVLAGHSQGGHAVLSAARHEQLSDYPLVAVAALAPGLDVRAQYAVWFEMVDRLQLSGDPNAAADRVFNINVYGAYLAHAFSQELEQFQPQSLFGQTVSPLIDRALDETQCGDFATLVTNELRIYLLGGNSPSDFPGMRQDWVDNPALASLLEREFFSDEPQSMPLLIVQGDADDLLDVSVADAFVEQQRTVGTPLEYVRASGAGHGDVIRGEFGRTLEFIARFLPVQ